MDANQKILNSALHLFFRYGIKHVTMDDIAKELGMSKKTIYQSFKEKDDLVNQLCSCEIRQQEKEFNSISKTAKDPIHEIILISDKLREMMQHINPLFFLDLQKFYPEAYTQFNSFRDNCAYQNVRDNIKRGVELGYYRSDIDVEFASKYRLAQIDMMMFGNYFTYEKISLVKTSQYLLEMFVYGICTVKGHKLLNHYKKINEDE